MMSEQQALVRSAISSRLNIIISGGTGSGKTTLANAVINEIVKSAPAIAQSRLDDTPFKKGVERTSGRISGNLRPRRILNHRDSP